MVYHVFFGHPWHAYLNNSFRIISTHEIILTMLNLKRKEEEKFFFSPYRPVDPYLLYIPIMKSRLSGFRRKEEKKKKGKNKSETPL